MVIKLKDNLDIVQKIIDCTVFENQSSSTYLINLSITSIIRENGHVEELIRQDLRIVFQTGDRNNHHD